jgi:hypothetical protein
MGMNDYAVYGPAAFLSGSSQNIVPTEEEPNNDRDPLEKELDAQLVEAVEKEDLEAVKSLLGLDTLKELEDSFDTAAVEICDMINTYVPRAHPNMPQSYSHHAPLFIAAGKGNAEIVAALIAAGAEIDAIDLLLTMTSLQWASSSGHIDVVRILLEARANSNFHRTVTMDTALYRAAGEGYPEIVQLLLDCHADTSIRGRGFVSIGLPPQTPLEVARSKLQYAIRNEEYERIQRLKQVIHILEEHEKNMGTL